MKRYCDSDGAAYYAVEELEPALQSAEHGDESPLHSMLIRHAPPGYEERLESALRRKSRPASPRTQQLADAFLEHKRLIDSGMKDGDAFKAVCKRYSIKESILSNTLSKSRSDVNAELCRRSPDY